MNVLANKIIFFLSLLSCLLILRTSVNSLTDPNAYYDEALSWRFQCYGQDLINLILIVPCFLISSIFVLTNYILGRYLWPGVVVYVLYTYIIYCFDVHFNKFFIEYCLILGLNFYALIYFIYTRTRVYSIKNYYNSTIIRTTSFYLVFIALVFYVAWLLQIVPAIRNETIPSSLIDSGLLTNPIHVIDLSVILPCFFITGILLLRGKDLGFLLVAPLLMFIILMDITITTLNIMTTTPSIALTVTFVALGLFSLILLIVFIKTSTLSNSSSAHVHANSIH